MSRNSWWSRRGVDVLSEPAVQPLPEPEQLSQSAPAVSMPASPAPPRADCPIAGLPPAEEPGSRRRRRRPRRYVWAFALLATAAAAAAVGIVRGHWNKLPIISTVGSYVVREGQLLEIDLAAQNWQSLPPLEYSLVAAPVWSKVDRHTGRFSWRPTDLQGPREHPVRLRAQVIGQPERFREIAFTIQVEEVPQPPKLGKLDTMDFRCEDGILFVPVRATDRDRPPTGVNVQFEVEPPVKIAWFDDQRELFCWAPQPEELEKEFVVRLRAQKKENPEVATEQTLKVTLDDAPGRIERMIGSLSYEALRRALNNTGYHASPSPQPAESAYGGLLREMFVLCEPVQTIDYVRPKLAAQRMSQFTPHNGVIDHPLAPSGEPLHCFQRDRIIAVYQGRDPEVIRLLTAMMGQAKIAQNVAERPSEAPPGVARSAAVRAE